MLLLHVAVLICEVGDVEIVFVNKDRASISSSHKFSICRKCSQHLLNMC